MQGSKLFLAIVWDTQQGNTLYALFITGTELRQEKDSVSHEKAVKIRHQAIETQHFHLGRRRDTLLEEPHQTLQEEVTEKPDVEKESYPDKTPALLQWMMQCNDFHTHD